MEVVLNRFNGAILAHRRVLYAHIRVRMGQAGPPAARGVYIYGHFPAKKIRKTGLDTALAMHTNLKAGR